MFKDKNLAENWKNLAENLKKSNSAEFLEFAFYNSGCGYQGRNISFLINSRRRNKLIETKLNYWK